MQKCHQECKQDFREGKINLKNPSSKMNTLSQTTKYCLCVIILSWFFALNHFIRFIVNLDRVFFWEIQSLKGTSFTKLLFQSTTNALLQRGGAWGPYIWVDGSLGPIHETEISLRGCKTRFRIICNKFNHQFQISEKYSFTHTLMK